MNKLECNYWTPDDDISIEDGFVFVPHHYTFRPAVACIENGEISWFDIRTGEELPPYFGYGYNMQEKVNEWYRNKK